MNYYGAKELAAAFRTVRKHTIQIAEDIPENQYEFRAAPETRTVARTLVHIAISPRFQLQMQRSGTYDWRQLDLPAFFQELIAEESKPRTKAEILALLKSGGDEFAAFLEGLSESFLAEPVLMPSGP